MKCVFTMPTAVSQQGPLMTSEGSMGGGVASVSLGLRVRTGGARKWGMAWSSQMMLSSQRPYTSSSLSMGKMENQGESSSWDTGDT